MSETQKVRLTGECWWAGATGLVHGQVVDATPDANGLARWTYCGWDIFDDPEHGWRGELVVEDAPVESDFERKVADEVQAIQEMLVSKNRAYGDAALNPIRVFSNADPTEQLKVRIDDKLSRLKRGSDAGEDVIKDLIGYLILYRISQNEANG